MDIVVVPSLKSELMSSTALTPTQHKGGSKVAAAVGIAAAIAIPYAAPAIASSIGSSFAVGSAASTFWGGAAGAALVGAGLGAATAYATGGDPLLGAAGGGLSGGIAGYGIGGSGLQGASGINLGTAARSPAGFYPSTMGTTGAIGAPITPSPVGLVGAPVASLGAMEPGAFYTGATPVVDPSLGIGPRESFVGALERQPGQTFQTAITTGESTPMRNALMRPAASGPAYPNDAALAAAPYTPPTLSQQIASGATNLGNKLSEGASKLVDKALSDDALKQVGAKLVTTGVGNVMAGDEPDMTAEEQARMAALDEAREFQRQQRDVQQARADDLYQQALNVNPVAAGQESAIAVRNQLARANAANLRKLGNPNMVDATRRRNVLDMARGTGTAFTRGRTEAENRRAGLTGAAIGASPTGAGYAGDIAGDLGAADARYKRLAQERTNAAGLFTPIAQSIFSTESDEDIRKRLAEGIAR